MKVRTGFVSNSSTSSFVMVGKMVNATLRDMLLSKTGKEELEDAVKELDLDVEYAYEEEYVGVTISRSYDGYYDSVEQVIEKVQAAESKIGDLFDAQFMVVIDPEY